MMQHDRRTLCAMTDEEICRKFKHRQLELIDLENELNKRGIVCEIETYTDESIGQEPEKHIMRIEFFKRTQIVTP